MMWIFTLFLLSVIPEPGVTISLSQSVIISKDVSHIQVRNRRSPLASEREKCRNQPNPNPTAELEALRRKLLSNNLKAYIVPMDDSHQSEYVSDHDKRIKFISKFSGSAGTVVITETAAALWTDGRYFLQGEDQLDCNWILMRDGVEGIPSISEWLTESLSPGSRVGANPEALSYDAWMSYKSPIARVGLNMVQSQDLIDEVWDATGNRPAQTDENLIILGLEFAGESWEDKVKRVMDHMDAERANAVVVTALDESAWLFNLRGKDIVYNPVFFAYSIVDKDGARLYISPQKQTSDVRNHLKSNGCSGGSSCVRLKNYDDFIGDLRAITGSKILISQMSSYAVYSAADGLAQLEPPIVRILKGRKNPVEVQNLQKCHARDSAALIEFLVDLENDVKTGSREWTEVSAAEALANKRKEQYLNEGLSFATISAVGSNGAIIHYKPAPETNKKITTTEMYLLDSGGQYRDGTTDVTRTFHFGTPNSKEKEAYTRVLMGSIDLAMSIWPYGTYGRDIDAIARMPLWKVGWNYRHGTGHGIGMFLNVHEGPGRINIGYRPQRYESPLYGEMFHSDEPGYYEDGEFGVRLETIVMTEKVNTKYDFGGQDYIGFVPFTLVPFEPNLIDYDLLSPDQRSWLNAYNARCRKEVGDILRANGSMKAYEWVMMRTEPIVDKPTYTSSAAGPFYTLRGLMIIFLVIVKITIC